MSAAALPPGFSAVYPGPSSLGVDTRMVEIPSSAHTLDGFREWVLSDALPPGCQATFIAGKVLIDMSPERVGSHSAVKMEVSSVLYGLGRESGFGTFYPDGTLVSNRAAEVSNEPDGIFVSDATLSAGRARLVPSADGRDFVEIEGTPDMVLEIVSPSSLVKDTIRLRERYHRAEVAEYWLIDARGDDLLFDILRYVPTGFAETPAVDGWLPSAVFGRRFRLDRVRDPRGLWVYTLHVASLDPSA